MPKPSDNKPKSTFENINDLLSSTLWPLIIVIIFLIYSSEIGRVIKLIPEKLEKSTKVSAGGFSFEIQNAAKISGNEELGKIIKNLSENGIRKLLTLGIGRSNIVGRSSSKIDGRAEKFFIPQNYDVLLELESKGLLKADEPLQQFLTFFNTLKPDKKTFYATLSSDSTSTEKSEIYSRKITELSMSTSKLNSVEYNRIDDFGVELSDAGKKALSIIVKVINEQIKS